MKFERRQYEVKAVASIRDLFAQHRRVLAVGPTGCGKTVIASMLIKQLEGTHPSVLFVAHRYELVDQAHAALARLGIDAGVLMASEEALHGTERVNPKARVQVASVQTVARRGGPRRVDLIVFDEAHRAAADSYKDIAAQYPDALVLGLTATPCRADGRGLADAFDALYTIAQPSELHADDYLAKPRVFTAPIEALAELALKLKNARTAHGDYTPGSLVRVAESSLLMGHVVSEAIRIAPHVPKVVFACSVKHSRELAQRFRRRGIKAAHLDGETPGDERERILGDLRRGAIEVVCNVDVLSEGWDLPALGAVIIARPTKSLARFLQMAGRCTRPYQGLVPIVVDHGNNTLRHQRMPGADYEWTLDAGKQTEAGEPHIKSCPACLVAIPTACTECPACGYVMERSARREDREEVSTKLEEVNEVKLGDLRARVFAMAVAKKAPKGWAEKVLAEMVAA